MVEVASTLNEHRQRIMDSHGVETLPQITIKVWGDREAFEQAFLAQESGNATIVGGYTDAKNWEVRFFNFDMPVGLTAVHEFAHLVSIARNSTIDSNPRWLWEALAIYESGRPFVPEISELRCFGTSTGPTLNDLNQHPINIYRVGHYIADYIVREWGTKALIELIDYNGDTQLALGVSEEQFENAWHIDMVKRGATRESNPDC